MGAVAVAVVVGQAPAALATPTHGPNVYEVVAESLQPVLYAETQTPGTGTAADQSLKFYARTVGASTWNLLNGTPVAGLSGSVTLPAGRLSIEQRFEYRAEACDSTGCTSSDVQTGQVTGDVGQGERAGATRLPFTVGDGISASVDAGDGNLMVTIPQFAVPRVAGDLSVGAVYNNIGRWYSGDFIGSFGTEQGDGWRLSTATDVYLRFDSTFSQVVYYGPDGLTGVFSPVAGTTNYVSPAGFAMDLTGSPATGWQLYDHDSGDTSVFDTQGDLTTLKDPNNNQTVFNYSGQALTSIVGDTGPTAARTLTVTTASGTDKQITRISQAPSSGSGLLTRSATYAYNSDGRLQSITDTLGRVTSFTYDSTGDLASITAPGGTTTSFTFEGLGRVASVTQPTATTGVSAVTRFAYDATHTYVADPDSNQSQSVTTAAHTTYTLTTDGLKLIASAADPTGVAQSATYTPFLDVATAATAAGTTTTTHTANNGESLTGVQAATGAASSYTYGNTGAAQYSPSSSSDAQSNASTYTYNGTGNQLSATDAGNNAASVTYNSDGTVATSTASSGAVTSYGYNSIKQITSVTPPTGTSLTSRSYTYDGFGRLKTATTGGVTQTYTYDAADRVTRVSYSDGTHQVTYHYNSGGQVDSRVDASGTTTFGYDPLGRLTTRANTAGGGTITYAYDRAGNLTTDTNTVGTTTYSYDTRETVTAAVTDTGTRIAFATDPSGRRTDTWDATNAGNTTWAAHSHTDYDASSRITRTWTARASNDATRVSDYSYSYASPGTAACTTAPPAGQDTSLRWSQTDNVTGVTTNYCYDHANRLIHSSTTAGHVVSYTYDADGNLTRETADGTNYDSTFNAADQLTSTGYTYDAAGNQTTSAEGSGGYYSTFNGAGQLIHYSGSGTDTTATYAGTDQTELITHTDPNSGSRTYTYGRTNSNGLPVIESFTDQDPGASTPGTYAYIYDPNGTPLALRGAGTTNYLAVDGLGSTTALINQAGSLTTTYTYTDYDAYAGGWASIDQDGSNIRYHQLYTFTGGILDIGGGLIHFGRRWYSPETGRFTQQDDIETIADPTRANRYLYGAGNPVNYVDPTGESAAGCISHFVLFAIGNLPFFKVFKAIREIREAEGLATAIRQALRGKSFSINDLSSDVSELVENFLGTPGVVEACA